jgi:hypothetical protein
LGRPTDNNADQADWFISAEAREWQRQQDGKRQNTSVKLGIMKWISRLLMLIVLALGYMCLQSAASPGLTFIRLLQPGPAASLGAARITASPGRKA